MFQLTDHMNTYFVNPSPAIININPLRAIAIVLVTVLNSDYYSKLLLEIQGIGSPSAVSQL